MNLNVCCDAEQVQLQTPWLDINKEKHIWISISELK